MSKKRGEAKMDITDSTRCPAAIAEYRAKELLRDAIARGDSPVVHRDETKMADTAKPYNVMKEFAESMGAMSEAVRKVGQPRPRSRTFTAKPCSVCAALREPDTNFTRVYATRDRVRYCKCTYCKNTWKDSDS
jgi:hypothetical protein